MNTKNSFFSPEQEDEIILAIQEAERETSGEIRLHIDWETEKSQLERAKEVFLALKMDETKERNAVLFHLSIKNKGFSILGDRAIDEKTGAFFWEDIKKILELHFKKEEFTLGLVLAIKETGMALKKYFPYQSNDINELPDEISKS